MSCRVERPASVEADDDRPLVPRQLAAIEREVHAFRLGDVDRLQARARGLDQVGLVVRLLHRDGDDATSSSTRITSQVLRSMTALSPLDRMGVEVFVVAQTTAARTRGTGVGLPHLEWRTRRLTVDRCTPSPCR